MKRLLTIASLALSLAVSPAFAQQSSTTLGHPVIPPDSRQATQPGAWEKIAVPPLAAFHPAQPRRVVLPNGIVLLLEEDHELPFINGTIEVHGGSRDLPASKAAMADLYGEVWRTSGTASMDGDAMDDLLEAKAAKIETGADVDSSSVAWSCLKENEDQVFNLAVDLLLHPRFDPRKLQLAQQEAIAGIVRRNDDSDGIAGREAAKLVYGPASPYAHVSEIADVMGVTVADFQGFHDRTVVANNIIVGVEGDFDAAAVEAKLRAALGGIPKGQALPKPQDTLNSAKPGLYLVDKKDIDQSNVWIVGPGIRRDDPDFYTFSVMDEIFGGGFGSRLFQDVRTRLGLAYSVGGGMGTAFDHPGMFRVVALTKSGSTEAAAAEMMKQVRALQTTPFTEDELRLAKDQVLSSFVFNYDTPDKILSAALRLEFYGYPADYLDRYRAGVEKVTTADLARVAKTRIDPSKLAALIVGNQAQFGGNLQTLGFGAPIPIDISIPVPAALRGAMGGGESGAQR